MKDKSTDIHSRYANFLDEVYLCGIKECTRSIFRSIKICWILIICFGVLATGWYLVNMAQEYMQSPIATKIEFKDTGGTYNYPNVVLCPDRWIDYESLSNKNISQKAVEFAMGHIFSLSKGVYIVEANKSGEEEFLSYIRSNNIYDYRDFYELIAKPGDRFCRATDNWVSNLRVNATKMFINVQVCYLLQLDKLDCSKQTNNRAPTVDVMYSNDIDEIDDENYHYLYIEPDLKFITDTSPDKILLDPGTNYAVSVHPKKFFSLNTSQRPCRDEEQYSQTECFIECISRNYDAIYEDCLFVNLLPRRRLTKFPDYKNPYCNVFNRENPGEKRNESLFQEIGSTVCNTECIRPCDRALNEIVVSHASAKKKTTAVGGIPKASVEILYDVCDKGVMEIREYQRYTFANLLADAGGVLGLWISASAVTFVQVIMCLLEMGVMKLTAKRTVTSVQALR